MKEAIGGAESQWNGEPGVLHTELPTQEVEPGRGTMVYRDDGSVIMFTGKQGFVTRDGGRTWEEPFSLKIEAGADIAHPASGSLKLQSGKIGLLTGEGGQRSFQTSGDGGRTFSRPVSIAPHGTWYAGHRSQVTQLGSGRIIVPVYDWAGRAIETTWERAPWSWSGMCYSYVFYSDDEGQTWQKSANSVVIVVDYWTPGTPDVFAAFEEPTAVELRDGRVLMVGRNRMGRQFQTFSSDGGMTWSIAEPTELASSYAPAEIRRIPATGDLLICWNQISKQEIIDGLNRHRLTVAISTDEGKTWGNFKNLYALDDYNYVRPDPPQIIVPGDQWVERGPGEVPGVGSMGVENVYMLPEDRSRYHREPAGIRTCYPLLCITDEEVLVSYEMSNPMPSLAVLDIFPIDWLYEAIVPEGPYVRLTVEGRPVEGADITLEDGTAFGWADVLGRALGIFEPMVKRTRVPVRIFLENYGASIPEGGWHADEGPRGTIHAQRVK